MLIKLKRNNASLITDVAGSQTAIATGEVDVLVGGGEWVTAGLAEEKPLLDFAVPDEGGFCGRKPLPCSLTVSARTWRWHSSNMS